ncbi:MAG: FN3 associated domain-containing protein [Mariniphaga sp.]
MSEKKIYQLLELCLWFLNPFLIILAIYNQEIQPGLFLQWMGKFHPLVLHFPIVFGILIIVYFIFFQNKRIPFDTEKLLLAANAILSGLVAICGLLLAKQNAYDNELINWHKWGGIAIAFFSWSLLYVLNFKIRHKKYISLLFLLVLITATHKGAQLTHGVNVLEFPESAAPILQKNSPADDSETVFNLGISPILAQKCISCHGSQKIKGKLQLDTPEHISAGGEDGNILIGNLKEEPMLFERIHLPLSHEKHMPPDGKMQLTPDEITILSKWIKSGSNFKNKLSELAKEDSLFVLVNKNSVLPIVTPKTNLPDLKEFNSDYCAVNYLFSGSDEIAVNFFQGTFYNREYLQKLTKIKSKIVRLNMQGMPLTKEDLNIIVQFNNLEKINLNYTRLDMASLGGLKSITKLKSVSICGIEFDETRLNTFLDQAKFSSVNIWSKTGNKKQLEKLIVKYPAISIIVGDNLEDELMKISNPTIEQDSSVLLNHIDIKLKHLLKGTVIRYTSDGTDPDSVNSPVYSNPIRLTNNTLLKVKAYRPGWKSSDIVQRTFYKSEIHPDTIYFVKNPDPKYKGHGAKTLIDYELGENNTSNGRWLAFRDNDMEFVIGFKQSRHLNSAYFNSFLDLGAQIFPMTTLSVQGSNDSKIFKNIVAVKIPSANKTDQRGLRTFSCNFPNGTSYKYYKFTATNLKKLPVWHSAKGKPAWIFVDELFLN